MPYLKQLFLIWNGCCVVEPERVPAIDPDKVSASEPITRFINEKSKFKSKTMEVRHNAFVPPKNFQLSAYRTDGLDEAEIWNIAAEYVAPGVGKPIIARADLLASEIRDKGLEITPTKEPHPRHCNVINWPKDDWIAVAIALAAVSRLVLNPAAK
jgi:hypothetical protein